MRYSWLFLASLCLAAPVYAQQPSAPPTCEQRLQVCQGWRADTTAIAENREARLLQACEAQIIDLQKKLAEAKPSEPQAKKAN